MIEEQPNIVLVSVDSLRADHCGFLGDEHGLTPTLDAMAADGVNFETAVATGPQTFSSMPAIFTGVPRQPEALEEYPGESHWERRLSAVDAHLETYSTLPERLGMAGYSTAGFSPNPWTSEASGFDRGFDYFADISGETDDGLVRRVVERTPGIDETSKPVELALDLLTGSSFFTRWRGFYDELLDVSQRLSEPYFLWIFLLDTHYPFLPTRRYRTEQSLLGTYLSTIRSEKTMRGHSESLPERVRESMLASYRDSVRSVDAFFERLQTDLAADDPTLIVHSDHGESFGDHGNYGHHHREVYEENVHVPYVVSNGGARATVTDPTSLSTIPSVALSIARDGTFDPEQASDRAVVTSSECGTNRAVRERRFKFVEHGQNRVLYDLQRDPGEQTDVAADYPETFARLRTRLERQENHVRETQAVSRAVDWIVDGNKI